MRVDRLVTLCVLLASLAFVFVVIPAGTEKIEGGMISPDSLPLALGWMIIGLSAIQLANPFEPLPDEMPDRLGLARALAIIALAAVCAWLIPMTGFLPASMVLAIGACVMMRERRWYVVMIAGVVMPVAIWFAITQLLGRPLP